METTYYDALTRRDPAFEGTFIYAVTTTGVYCRPTCASRRPLERNVRFFTNSEAARAAGFRACKRCRPDHAAGGAQPDWLARACALLETAEAPPTLDALAAEVGVSRAHLQRTFSKAVGVSPHRYAASLRDRRLRSSLRSGSPVSAATYESGFGSSSRLYETAAATIGMTPAQYRRGAAGLTLAFGIVSSALGYVIVALTDRGVAHVALGDDAAELERALRASFPGAVLERADDRAESATSALVRYIAGTGPWPTLPLDVRATAFQARACATNPVALLIPCHRVIAKDGDLRGYRWGIERKQRLLERERRPAAVVAIHASRQ
jgi:AraC family transcriptional regulator of adaptative response/methylated-DNA-[protein]-cysteine methyltransferase